VSCDLLKCGVLLCVMCANCVLRLIVVLHRVIPISKSNKIIMIIIIIIKCDQTHGFIFSETCLLSVKIRTPYLCVLN
jgi:hypothetical protein